MDRRLPDEAEMTIRPFIELIHEKGYAAEVTVELIETGEGWSPYLSAADALELDRVGTALRRGDHVAAAKEARVFELLPLAG